MLPAIPGLETFAGKAMHTARWDHGYDLTSKRVAVIGTGASAVQVVPEIAPLVTQLRVFQRTPIWIGPRLDRPLPAGSRCRCAGSALIRKLLRAGLRVEPRVPHVLHRQLPPLAIRGPAGAAKPPRADAATGQRSGDRRRARCPVRPGLQAAGDFEHLSADVQSRQRVAWSRSQSSASARKASSPLTRRCMRWTRSSSRPAS